MLLAVFSDSHGNREPMRRAIRAHNPDMVLHLGDYARDAAALADALPGLEVRYVRGNCDVGSPAPETLCFALEGVSVFMTHGHLYSVKYTLQSLANAAIFPGRSWRCLGTRTRRTTGGWGMCCCSIPALPGEGMRRLSVFSLWKEGNFHGGWNGFEHGSGHRRRPGGSAGPSPGPWPGMGGRCISTTTGGKRRPRLLHRRRGDARCRRI